MIIFPPFWNIKMTSPLAIAPPFPARSPPAPWRAIARSVRAFAHLLAATLLRRLPPTPHPRNPARASRPPLRRHCRDHAPSRRPRPPQSPPPTRAPARPESSAGTPARVSYGGRSFRRRSPLDFLPWTSKRGPGGGVARVGRRRWIHRGGRRSEPRGDALPPR